MDFKSEQICFEANVWVFVFLVTLGIGLVDLLRWIFKLVFDFALSFASYIWQQSFALYIWQHLRASNSCKHLVTAICDTIAEVDSNGVTLVLEYQIHVA